MQIHNIMFCKGNEFYSRNRTTVIKHSGITRFAICIFKILAEREVNIFYPFHNIYEYELRYSSSVV